MPLIHVALWSLINSESVEELIKFTKSIPTEAKKYGKPYTLMANAGYNAGLHTGAPIRRRGTQSIWIKPSVAEWNRIGLKINEILGYNAVTELQFQS